MTLPVLTAVTGGWEAPLVSGLERSARRVVVVRRCVDMADLLAAAAAGQARAVVLSADLRRLNRDSLVRLAAAEVAVVALVEPGDEEAERRLRQLGITRVLPADTEADEVAEQVAAAVADLGAGTPVTADEGTAPANGIGVGPGTRLALGDPAAAMPAVDHSTAQFADDDGTPRAPGRLVAVWGPAGAPGRTTVAVTLAAELAGLVGAADARGVLLADADTYSGSVSQVLALLDEAPGLAAAVRAAGQGQLDLPQLARLAPFVVPALRVLTGVSRSSRWPELRPSGLEVVWELARELSTWTVADCGFCLEQDEELSYDTAAPRRNGATLATLAAADQVVAVGAADPVGLQRLVRGLQDLAEVLPGVRPVVVVTRVRSSAVGADPGRRITEALARYAGVEEPLLVPDDRAACDAALLAGRTLTEAAPSSPARLALRALAERTAGLGPGTGRRGRRSRAVSR